MSYTIELAFKQIPKSDVLDFIEEFKKVILRKEVQEEILEDNFRYCPYHPYSRYPKENYNSTRELAEFWLRALFTYKFVYLDQFGVLAVVVPEKDYLEPLFDGFIYAQDGCDQDYPYETWEGIPVFKEISDKIRNMPKEEFGEICEYSLEDCDEEISSKGKTWGEYYRQSYIYEDIYRQIEDDLWGNGPKVTNICLLYSFEDLMWMRVWLEKRCLNEQEKDRQWDEEWKLLSDEEKTKKLEKFYPSEKIADILSKEKLKKPDNINLTTEVFFRAKVKGWKPPEKGFHNWKMGGYHKHLSKVISPQEDLTITEEDYKYFLFRDGGSDLGFSKMVDVLEIDRDTLCICTGIRNEKTHEYLFDKDVIEIEYYENGFNRAKEKYLITYNGFKFEKVDERGNRFILDKKPEKFNIIGNIIDNPELIKVR